MVVNLIFAFVSVYALIQRKKFIRNEDQDLVRAYTKRSIQTAHLAEFSFVSHETTAQGVIDKLGPPSSIRQLPVAANPNSGAAYSGFNRSIPIGQYDLPYGGAVMIMPEYPFGSQDKIRATFYRGPKYDDSGFESG